MRVSTAALMKAVFCMLGSHRNMKEQEKWGEHSEDVMMWVIYVWMEHLTVMAWAEVIQIRHREETVQDCAL